MPQLKYFFGVGFYLFKRGSAKNYTGAAGTKMVRCKIFVKGL